MTYPVRVARPTLLKSYNSYCDFVTPTAFGLLTLEKNVSKEIGQLNFAALFLIHILASKSFYFVNFPQPKRIHSIPKHIVLQDKATNLVCPSATSNSFILHQRNLKSRTKKVISTVRYILQSATQMMAQLNTKCYIRKMITMLSPKTK